jgi:hypothetical protein
MKANLREWLEKPRAEFLRPVSILALLFPRWEYINLSFHPFELFDPTQTKKGMKFTIPRTLKIPSPPQNRSKSVT